MYDVLRSKLTGGRIINLIRKALVINMKLNRQIKIIEQLVSMILRHRKNWQNG